LDQLPGLLAWINVINMLDKRYDFKKIEEKIYQSWEEGGYFNPDKLPLKKTAQPYTTMLPPPNITGSLHIGHALNATVQDIVIRQKRMAGFKALWLPGIDHAGIATQNVVEKKLAKKGQTKEELGQKRFLEKIWEWKKESGDQILSQLKKLGASCDWSRTRFTLDKDYQTAVKTAFLEYQKRGYLYQGTRVVNWCPRCGTTLSDLELEYQEQKSDLWQIKYPLKKSDGNGKAENDQTVPKDQRLPESIVVATTRPETMLGDTGVAVHPSDKRYQRLIGQKVILPLTDREVPIVGDRVVDPKFGTGAVKVTPSSDINDELIGQRHNLPTIKIINREGRLTKEVPKKYQGLSREQARKTVVADLEKENLIVRKESIDNRVATCYRCQTVIEPLPSKQWFVKMDKLKEPAIKAVQEGKVSFYPKRYKKIYLNWLEEVRDWCISRQIWWGHPLPIKGSPDVLDTWFSSALWPFATLGWPKKSKDLKNFYPNQLLVTDKGILYLWVARMIFSGLEFTGQPPFSKVYIHATVKNRQGERMSKSLGTGIDPLDLIEKYGADGLRFSLAWNSGYNQEIRYSEDDLTAGRNFNNKLWNATRFILINAKKNFSLPTKLAELKPTTPENKAVKKELGKIINQVTKDIERYRFDLALQANYHFFWHRFCDQCLEKNKETIFSDDPRKKEEQRETIEFLAGVLAISLKLFHPFIPHITESLWQELQQKFNRPVKPLIISSWPKPETENS
jgi:valyl-tRNA synthetase